MNTIFTNVKPVELDGLTTFVGQIKLKQKISNKWYTSSYWNVKPVIHRTTPQDALADAKAYATELISQDGATDFEIA